MPYRALTHGRINTATNVKGQTGKNVNGDTDSQKKAYDGFVELKESMYSGDFDFDSFLALKEVQLHTNRNIKLINFDEEKGAILAVYNCQDSGCAYTIFMKYEKFEI